jgi:polysaccharide deacetylase family protein (PEP-CTERM system associated)
MENNISNVLTFDIEDWYHCTFLNIPEKQWDKCEGRIEPQLNNILRLLKKTNNNATFFTVALLARRSPELIKRIVAEGHELAWHSYSHKMVTEQTAEEFEIDIKNSLDIFSSISDQKIVGFRAPYWSVNDENKKSVVTTLKKHGLLYDSSIFPFKTFQYGDNKAHRYPNVLSADNGSSIYEIPPSVIQYSNYRIPFSGGFYFRMLPYVFIKKWIKKTNKEGYPAIMYFHPYDMDPEQPRIIKGFRERTIMYTNQKGCKKKFEQLLHDFRFGRMDEYVKGMTLHH